MPPQGTSSRSLERIARERAMLGPAPKVMSWWNPAAILALMVALGFDAIRAFFEWLGFALPALGGVITGAIANYFLGSVAGYIAGGVTAVAGGVFVGPELEGFGLIMAEVIGLAGFFAILGLLFFTNARIFKANETALFWLLITFVVTEVPFLDTVPMLGVFVWHMYRTQISKEREARAGWQARNEALDAQELQLKLALLQERQARAEADTLAAANDNDAIPEGSRAAA